MSHKPSQGDVGKKFAELYGQPVDDTSSDPIVYHGEPLTEERADQIREASLAEARRRNLIPGRKSLSGGSKHSPVVQVRVPESLEELLNRRVKAESTTRAKLIRRALEEYLSR